MHMGKRSTQVCTQAEPQSFHSIPFEQCGDGGGGGGALGGDLGEKTKGHLAGSRPGDTGGLSGKGGDAGGAWDVGSALSPLDCVNTTIKGTAMAVMSSSVPATTSLGRRLKSPPDTR